MPVVIGILTLILLIYLVVKNARMIKYKKLYSASLKSGDRSKAMEYGKLYYRYKTNSSEKNAIYAQRQVEKDIEANGMKG